MTRKASYDKNRPPRSYFFSEKVVPLHSMKITDYIRGWFGGYQVLRRWDTTYIDIDCGRTPFGRTVYVNIVQLLTDIYAEVEWTGVDTPKFRAWKRYVDRNGQRLLTELLTKPAGYAVIAYTTDGEQYTFWQLDSNEYTEHRLQDGSIIIRPKQESLMFHILKSPTFDQLGESDYHLCMPYIRYIDNALNASSTICERLGTFVIVSPKTPASAPMLTALNEKQKKDMEQALQTEYGALRKQNQVMLLPNEVATNVVNLAGLDLKTNERVRTAILAICDRIKVPANQVAIIDANSSKSLSNGTELREGDLAKYRSFMRLLNATLYDMAQEIGLTGVNYTIENEPKTAQNQTIENDEQTAL